MLPQPGSDLPCSRKGESEGNKLKKPNEAKKDE